MGGAQGACPWALMREGRSAWLGQGEKGFSRWVEAGALAEASW